MINTNKIINKIQEIRSKNNVNWMDLLRIAIKKDPKNSRKVISNIYQSDSDISDLVFILNQSSKINKIISLNKVGKDDCDIILNWRNDPISRLYSRNKNIILKKDHIKWFNLKLNSKNDITLIAKISHLRLGTVRYDKIKEKLFEVSININPNFRKIGLSKQILKLSEKEIKAKDVLIKAFVLKENLASIKLFKSCKYKIYKIAKSGLVEFRKKLTN